jgi:hypothetical protein
MKLILPNDPYVTWREFVIAWIGVVCACGSAACFAGVAYEICSKVLCS